MTEITTGMSVYAVTPKQFLNETIVPVNRDIIIKTSVNIITVISPNGIPISIPAMIKLISELIIVPVLSNQNIRKTNPIPPKNDKIIE